MQVIWMLATLAVAGQLGERYPQEATAAAKAPPAETAATDAGRPAGESAGDPSGAAATSVTVSLQDTKAAAATDPAANSEIPERSVVAVAAGPKPSELIRTFLKPPAAGPLPGVPLTLGEAVRTATSRQNQTERAKAYWNLSAAVGETYLAVLERTQLGALKQMVTAPSPAWDQKLREADARVELARSTAQAAQLRLQQLVGGAALPLPADVPHCGRYNTEYDEIFKAQPNLAAKQLHELMPLRYEQLRFQAGGVAEANDWLTQVSQTRDPSTDGTGLLQAYDLLSLRRRALLATARDYNQEIASYTELAAPDVVGSDRLVAMMIRTSGSGDAPWERSAVAPASANEELSGSEGAAATAGDTGRPSLEGDGKPDRNETPRTYRSFRRPFQRLFNREKSIVVNRFPLLRRDSNRNNRDE